MATYKPLWAHALDLIDKCRIYISDKRLIGKNLFKENPLQAILVHILVRSRGLGVGREQGRILSRKSYDGRELVFLGLRGGEESELIYPGKDYITHEDLVRRIPDRPLIVFENRYYSELVEADRAKTLFQLSLTLGVVRRWLWDRHIIMLNAPSGLREDFNRINPSNKVVFLDSSNLTEIVRGSDHIIALDPYAEDVLDDSVLRASSIIVIGGIVDRARPVRGVTSRILELLERDTGLHIRRYRLEIDGIPAAVPHRLNRIVEILLRSIIDGVALRKSIIMSMSNRDIAWYLGILYRRHRSKDLIMERIAEIEGIKGRRISREVLEHASRIAGLGEPLV